MKLKKSYPIILVLALFVMPLLTACGPQKVDVTLSTYKLVISNNAFSVGDVAFHVTNTATDQIHEFLIFKTDLAPDKLPTLADGSIDEENGEGITRVEDSGDIKPGEVFDTIIYLPAGNYVAVCNMTVNAIHYQRGMRFAFTVK